MHSIHTTSGIVLKSRPYGEADKMLSIFTSDLGLVTATARGIRLEKSKLRYHVQDYSFGTFSLVRGKEYWRLTSAGELRLKDVGKLNDRKNQEVMVRISLLLSRLLQGEESHPKLFDYIRACYEYLSENDLLGEITEEHLKTLESVTVYRILHSLGYISGGGELDECFKEVEMTAELIFNMGNKRTIINQHINKALKESHL